MLTTHFKEWRDAWWAFLNHNTPGWTVPGTEKTLHWMREWMSGILCVLYVHGVIGMPTANLQRKYHSQRQVKKLRLREVTCWRPTPGKEELRLEYRAFVSKAPVISLPLFQHPSEVSRKRAWVCWKRTKPGAIRVLGALLVPRRPEVIEKGHESTGDVFFFF